MLRALIDELGPLGDARAGRPADAFGALARAIVGQQVSTAAARSMFARLTDRFGGRSPTPAEILAEDPEALRALAGLSRAKVRYLRALAEAIASGRLALERLDECDDAEASAALVAIPGIGPWSAQIFLMFHLGRPDVLPVGDLGIRRAVMLRYALPQLPDAGALEAIAEPWRPHRTLACRYLWASLRAAPA